MGYAVQTDRYTKIVLTVIALLLAVITTGDVFSCGGSWKNACRVSGDVSVSGTVTVESKRSRGQEVNF